MNSRAALGFGSVLVVAVLLAAAPALADFAAAMSYFKDGKWLEAASEFQVLVDESPEYADGYFMLGICFMKTGKPGDAERNFIKAIELNPDKFEYQYNLANVYQQLGNYAKVVQTLNTAEGLLTDGGKPSFYKLRGFAYASQKNWEAAIDDLLQVTAVNPDPVTLNQLGKAYFALGQYDEASAKLNAAIRLNPDNAESYRLLAESRLNLAAKGANASQKKTRYGEALKAAEKFVQLEPASFDAVYLVGRSALGAGDYDRAIAAFSNALQLKSDHCNAMANQGKAYTAQGDWSNALAALNNAIECSPDMALAWESKGYVLQKQGTEAKSIETYQQAIQAYEKADAIKPSKAAKKAIADCSGNIEVINDNLQASLAEAANEEEIRKAQAEFEDAQRREKEWKEKIEDDD